ncbi:MAG: extracellular solute-binding protein [Actinobacteria bacterium]|nr:extracellular solute-binding protein [Actinomycetota bacterium]
MQRNLMLGGAVVSAGTLAALLDACGGSSSSSTSGGPTISQAEFKAASGTINVLGWQFYQAEAQNEGPVKAKWAYINSSAEIPTKTKPEGSFQVFTSNNGQMNQFFAEGRMVPLQTELLTNYHLVDAGLRDDPIWKGEDGKVYAVPLAVTAEVTAWDGSKVPEPKSLTDLLKPEYTGQVALLDDYQTINQLAQGLGLPLPPKLTKNDLGQVTEFMNELKPQVKTFFPFGGEVQLFSRGDIGVAFQSAGSLVLAAQENNKSVRSNFVGSVSFVDALSLLSGGDEAAGLRWINQAFSVKAQEGLAEASFSNPTVDAARHVLPPPLNSMSVAELIEKAPAAGSFPVGAEGDAATLEDATKAWDEYKASF